MAEKLNLAAGLRHQEICARLHTLREQGKVLEARHTDYVKALKGLPEQGLYSFSDCCFIKLGRSSGTTALKGEKERLWKDIEEVQREIVKLEREILAIEIEAGLQDGLD